MAKTRLQKVLTEMLLEYRDIHREEHDESKLNALHATVSAEEQKRTAEKLETVATFEKLVIEMKAPADYTNLIVKLGEAQRKEQAAQAQRYVAGKNSTLALTLSHMRTWMREQSISSEHFTTYTAQKTQSFDIELKKANEAVIAAKRNNGKAVEEMKTRDEVYLSRADLGLKDFIIAADDQRLLTSWPHRTEKDIQADAKAERNLYVPTAYEADFHRQFHDAIIKQRALATALNETSFDDFIKNAESGARAEKREILKQQREARAALPASVKAKEAMTAGWTSFATGAGGLLNRGKSALGSLSIGNTKNLSAEGATQSQGGDSVSPVVTSANKA